MDFFTLQVIGFGKAYMQLETFELVAGLFPGIRIVIFPSFSFILFVVILSFSNFYSGVLNALIDAKQLQKKTVKIFTAEVKEIILVILNALDFCK